MKCHGCRVRDCEVEGNAFEACRCSARRTPTHVATFVREEREYLPANATRYTLDPPLQGHTLVSLSMVAMHGGWDVVLFSVEGGHTLHQSWYAECPNRATALREIGYTS